ncbi:MAG: hypothetical protein WC713_14585, partial [Candidatus Methylomirabilota bacterium]
RGFGRDAVRRFLSCEFESEPAIKSILARNLPVFTSSHAPFFLRSGAGNGIPPGRKPAAP